MSGIIVFIDDEESSRFIYGEALASMYGDSYSVQSFEPGCTIDEMIAVLNGVGNVVSMVIDEKLQVAAAANYRGSELVGAIRSYDPKVPIYILTSEMSLLSPPLGSVEMIIDKNLIMREDYKEQCTVMMLRHINTFVEIQSARAIRFNELLRKSLDEQLSELEVAEYNELDFLRVRRVMATEKIVGSAELDEQQRLVEEIELELKKARA